MSYNYTIVIHVPQETERSALALTVYITFREFSDTSISSSLFPILKHPGLYLYTDIVILANISTEGDRRLPQSNIWEDLSVLRHWSHHDTEVWLVC